MAHAHDRTLISSLGFNDPDKKDPLHDLGCQYIAQPHIFDAINLSNDEARVVFDEDRKIEFESVINKGNDQYKTTIGFIDAVIPVKNSPDGPPPIPGVNPLWVPVEVKITPVDLGNVLRQINLYCEYIYPQGNKFRLSEYQQWILSLVIRGDRRCLEPPSSVFNVADRWSTNWVLAAAFPMSTAMVEGLRSHDIIPVQLGDGFRKWVAEQHAAPRATDVVSL